MKMTEEIKALDGPIQVAEILKSFWQSCGLSYVLCPFHRDEALAMLKEYASLIIEYKTRNEKREKRRFKSYRRIYNKEKSWLHNMRFYKNCWICGKRAHVRHHIIQLQNGGDNRKKNLVSLCNECHEEIHPWLKNRARVDSAA